ncbi:carbon-phosphorus lyase complex subunit PhnI [Burkholderia cepacia]|uniref:carbon-phosphorus lyase complex subunit PhnI n=1 Tax=Burkholderia cepacia TaxID=292 RepID=UPI002AB7109C|nr:carbon-phosphorus lyase complex subunit PhnI [Burkholderia cepacia]
MMTSIKGGEAAIAVSHELLADRRRGDQNFAEMSVEQIREQLSLAVDRVMTEGSLYDPQLAALAVKQAQGDLMEAIFLLRSFRTTLNRFGYSEPLDTGSMTVRRRIATTHKDVPGGQLLGPTYDYTHRILDFSLMESDGVESLPDFAALPVNSDPRPFEHKESASLAEACGILARSDLMEDLSLQLQDKVEDITRDPIAFPSTRDQRLQNLSRGDEGFLTGLCYSTLRGYGNNHPFIGELRYGDATVVMNIPELDAPVSIGHVRVTECQTVHLTTGDGSRPPEYTRGYGLLFGHGERKALAMAILDRSLRASELGEVRSHPAQNEEFVVSHSDSVSASGLVQHLKLPHYVEFQAQMQLLQQLRTEYADRQSKNTAAVNASPEKVGDH